LDQRIIDTVERGTLVDFRGQVLRRNRHDVKNI